MIWEGLGGKVLLDCDVTDKQLRSISTQVLHTCFPNNPDFFFKWHPKDDISMKKRSRPRFRVRASRKRPSRCMKLAGIHSLTVDPLLFSKILQHHVLSHNKPSASTSHSWM
jgi:hypothetical protein